jgi:succinate dehydrogenase hydrophobic anchor subunit
MATKSRNLPLAQRGLNFEMFMWLFTRLSALAMYGFILLGAIGALIMGARTQMNIADIMRWAFMPTGMHVQNTNVPDITLWASPLWKLVGSGLLLLAVAHGVHGLVVIADDYFAGPRARQIVRIISIVFMLAMMAVGVYVLWTS